MLAKVKPINSLLFDLSWPERWGAFPAVDVAFLWSINLIWTLLGHSFHNRRIFFNIIVLQPKVLRKRISFFLTLQFYSSQVKINASKTVSSPGTKPWGEVSPDISLKFLWFFVRNTNQRSKKKKIICVQGLKSSEFEIIRPDLVHNSLFL